MLLNSDFILKKPPIETTIASPAKIKRLKKKIIFHKFIQNCIAGYSLLSVVFSPSGNTSEPKIIDKTARDTEVSPISSLE